MPGARARALALLLALVAAAALRDVVTWPSASGDAPRAGLVQDGELRVDALARVARLAAARAEACGLPAPQLAAGAAILDDLATAPPEGPACSLTVRSLPLGARRVLGLPSDPNALTADDFEQLRGIGPVLAQRIVRNRQRLGGFHGVEDLRRVPGVGPARMGQLRAALNPVAP